MERGIKMYYLMMRLNDKDYRLLDEAEDELTIHKAAEASILEGVSPKDLVITEDKPFKTLVIVSNGE